MQLKHWLTLLWRTERGDALNFKKLLQTFECVFNVLILVLLTKVLSTLLQFICSRKMLILKLCII